MVIKEVSHYLSSTPFKQIFDVGCPIFSILREICRTIIHVRIHYTSVGRNQEIVFVVICKEPLFNLKSIDKCKKGNLVVRGKVIFSVRSHMGGGGGGVPEPGPAGGGGTRTRSSQGEGVP